MTYTLHVTKVTGLSSPVEVGEVTRFLAPYNGGPPLFFGIEEDPPPAQPREPSGLSIIYGTRELSPEVIDDLATHDEDG